MTLSAPTRPPNYVFRRRRRASLLVNGALALVSAVSAITTACATPRAVGINTSAALSIRNLADTGGSNRPQPSASASGFAVSGSGVIVTNRHVVERCKSVAVRADSATKSPARIIALHAREDLALLRSDLPLASAASFRSGAPVRPGDDVVAVGFPLAGLLADEPSVTTGSVSALAGIHNNRSLLQMSAPVQQGSSGGPLFDVSGNVVGIVVTKLNARIVVEETGDLPQNVNFAIKSDIARAFLEEQGVSPSTSVSTARLSNADVGEIGRRVTVLVECYR